MKRILLSLMVLCPLFYAADAECSCVASERYSLPSSYLPQVGVWWQGTGDAAYTAGASLPGGGAPVGQCGISPSLPCAYWEVYIGDAYIPAACGPGGTHGPNTEGWECAGGNNSAYYYYCRGGGYGTFLLAHFVACGSTDMDCDSVLNTSDVSPSYTGTDSDGDGIVDSIDPWPNDPNLPGTLKFSRSLKMIRNSDGAWVQMYVDDSDPMNEDHWFYTSSSPSVGVADVNDSDWRVEVQVGGVPKAFNDFGFGAGEATAAVNRGDTAARGTNTSGNSSSSSSGGESGTSDYNNASGDSKIIADYLAGIQGNTGAMNDNLIGLLGIGDQIANNQAIQSDLLKRIADKSQIVDLTGVEEKLDEIKGLIPSVGSLEDLGEAPPSNYFGDNSDLGGSYYDDLYESESGSLLTWLGEAVLDNPIASVISGSGVTASGGVSSLNVSFSGYSFNLDFSPAQGVLEACGVFFLAFCGLAGLIVFLQD